MNKKTLSKRLLQIIETATPKKKAELVCKQWTESHTLDTKPLLTEEEMEALRDSLKDDNERREYNKWVHVYSVYSELTPLLGLVYKEYQGEAEKVVGYLRQWEALNQEENHLNAIFQEIVDSGSKEALDAFNRSVSHLTFSDAELRRDKDGYIEIDVTRLYDIIKFRLKEVWNTYGAAKAIVEVTERYTKRTRSASFMTEPMKAAIENIKADYSLRVAPRYSRKLLQEKRDKGQRISKEEEKRALYPYYEEIVPPQELLDLFEKQLNGIIAAYGK